VTGAILRILIIALIALVAVQLLVRDIVPQPEFATVLDAPRPLPDVALIDQNSAAFSFRDLARAPTFVFFGFTNCPDICPLTLGAIAEAVARIRSQSPEAEPQVVFVSVDAKRDTPEQIRSYLNGFDPAFIGVTADDQTLAPLLEALSVTVHKDTIGDEDYNVVHNGTIYVLDSDQQWIAIFGGSSHSIDEIVNDYPAIRVLATAG
jgi:protein SCO1/2